MTSDLVGDANVARHADQGAAGAKPACAVTDPRALNSCTLARRGPVVLAFFTDGAGRCTSTLDTMQRIAPQHPDVGFAAVAIRGDRGDVRTTVREHGWRFPVAEDGDGAVANIYGVAICPTVVLAYRGGVVMRTALGTDETTPRSSSAPCGGWSGGDRRRERPPAPDAHASGRAEPRDGWVAEELRAELPGLGIVSLELPAPRAKRSPHGVREHLAMLSTRFRGADALALRQRPVPHAYRVAFRHVGLDPDATRTPIEAAAIERLVQGGFVSRGLLDDALTIALVETGVPLWALDADAVHGELSLRLARAGEQLGDDQEAPPLPDGQIVVADARTPLAPLFGEPAADRAPRQTHRPPAAVRAARRRRPARVRGGGAVAVRRRVAPAALRRRFDRRRRRVDSADARLEVHRMVVIARLQRRALGGGRGGPRASHAARADRAAWSASWRG